MIWELLRNDSGVIFDLLEIDLGPFLGVKVHIWIIRLNINSKKKKIKI